jgi:DNA-binding PadR family transcriptional regulator
MHPAFDTTHAPFGRRHHHPGPGFGGFGPGPGRPGPGRHGRGRRGRAQRGDLRAAILRLLAEEPMHGYQLMQAIADRTEGRWTPSPGAIYPAINQLEDEGLVVIRAESGRKVVELTDAGRALLAEQGEAAADPFAAEAGPSGPDLRRLMMELQGATRQVAMAGTTAQLEQAAEILGGARRALYLLLADGPGADEA